MMTSRCYRQPGWRLPAREAKCCSDQLFPELPRIIWHQESLVLTLHRKTSSSVMIGWLVASTQHRPKSGWGLGYLSTTTPATSNMMVGCQPLSDVLPCQNNIRAVAVLIDCAGDASLRATCLRVLNSVSFNTQV